MERTNSTLRIAISGAVGSGKTTLAQDLANALQVPVLNENWGPIAKARRHYYATRQDASMGKDDRRAALRAWKLSYKEWLDTRHKAQSQHDGYVSDRWAGDAFSNWLRVFMETKDDRMARYLFNAMKDHSEMYDFFVVLPVADGGYEEKNSDGLKRNSSFHIGLMATGLTAGLTTYFLDRPVIRIPSREMTREERVAFVLEQIRVSNSR